MYLARAAAQGCGIGLHDSAIKSQVFINVSGFTTQHKDEVRATAGSEFASGKAIHIFIGHYRQTMGSSSQTTNIKEGQGAMYFADGGFFLGHWVNNQRFGMGALYSTLGYSYEGSFKADVPHGFGLEYFPSGQLYVVEFSEG
ncbi:MORN motif [Trypanosoma melophagium]|uniref:MORN motif n=1 Tax=Trypanosoma melophagium TaxID=715481 RepID=UPI00351A08A0|nr:MORN motif [Trypanosoma melophagium]